MKRIFVTVIMIVLGIVSMLSIGKIAWEDREEIEEELYHLSDYADEKFDEALDFVNTKVELVLKKD